MHFYMAIQCLFPILVDPPVWEFLHRNSVDKNMLPKSQCVKFNFRGIMLLELKVIFVLHLTCIEPHYRPTISLQLVLY